jgi:hypothetical protein
MLTVSTIAKQDSEEITAICQVHRRQECFDVHEFSVFDKRSQSDRSDIASGCRGQRVFAIAGIQSRTPDCQVE